MPKSNRGCAQFAFNYDEANRLVSMTRPGSQTNYSYDTGSSLTSIVHSAGGNIKSSFEFQYDLRNYITQKRSLASTLNYSYDSNGQLTNSNKVEVPAENEAFSYDALGNRLTYNGVSSTYDQTGQRIQDDGQYVYLYDANGNILAKNSKTNGVSYSFEYSAVNQLKKTTILAAPLSPIVQKIIEYKYDPVGRRIQRKVTDNIDPTKSNTKKYYYDGENILAETDDQNNVTASYTHSPLRPDDILSANFTDYAVSQSKGGMAISEGQVLADNKNAVYYLKDHLNSVTDIISSSGNIVQKFDYTAYGTVRSVKNSADVEVGFDNASVKTSFTYTGREYEPETGMYYYRARYYDPNTGRFLQTDPDPGKLGDPKTFLSKYIYAVNSPVMFSDPSGMSILSEIWNNLMSGGHDLIATLGAGFDNLVKNKEFQKALIITTALVAGFFIGPFMAGALGLTGGWAVLGSIVFGASVGGLIGGTGYVSLGLGSFQEGFTTGAIAGGIGGAIFSLSGGASPLDLANRVYDMASIAKVAPLSSYSGVAYAARFASAAAGLIGGSYFVLGGVFSKAPDGCSSLDIIGAPFDQSNRCKGK